MLWMSKLQWLCREHFDWRLQEYGSGRDGRHDSAQSTTAVLQTVRREIPRLNRLRRVCQRKAVAHIHTQQSPQLAVAEKSRDAVCRFVSFAIGRQSCGSVNSPLSTMDFVVQTRRVSSNIDRDCILRQKWRRRRRRRRRRRNLFDSKTDSHGNSKHQQ